MTRMNIFASFSITACLVVCGCDAAPATKAPSAAADSHDHDHDHAHPTEGPHHGVLVELGNEEYHAELVHDDATGLVTCYILDAHAEKAVAVAAPEVVINLKHGDAPEQFKLAAQPVDGEPAGQSSCFVLSSKELSGHLHDSDASARLNLTIGETPYSGAIPVNSHEGHDHAH